MKEIKLDLNGQHQNDENDSPYNNNLVKKEDNQSSSINLQKFKSFKSQQSKRESGRESLNKESPLKFKNNRSNSSLLPIENDELINDNYLQNVLNDNIVNLGSKYKRIVEQDEESNYRSKHSADTFNPEYKKTGHRNRSKDNSFEMKRNLSEDILQVNTTGYMSSLNRLKFKYDHKRNEYKNGLLVKRNEESLEHYRNENQNNSKNGKYRLNKSNSHDKISLNNSLSFKNNSFTKNKSNKSFEKEGNQYNSNSKSKD